MNEADDPGLVQRLHDCLQALAGDKIDPDTERIVRTLSEGIDALARRNRELSKQSHGTDPAVTVEQTHDETERQRQETEVRRSESLYRAIAQNIPGGGIFVFDTSLRYLVAEGSLLETLGISREVLEGRTPAEVFGDAGARRCEERLRRALGGETVSYESTRVGRALWSLYIPMRDDEGEIRAVMLLSLDITERKRAGEALRKSEERFHTIFDGIPVGVMIQSADGMVTAVNPAAEQILGVTEKEIVNIESIDANLRVIHEDGSPYPAEEHPSMVTLKTGLPVRDAVMGIYIQKERDYRWIVINTVPRFRDDEESPCEVFVTFDEITERKRAEEALLRHTEDLSRAHRDIEAAHREANLYLDILTHDIGNTENVSNLYADLLIETLQGEAARYAKKLKRSIEKSIEILGTVSTIRRIHAGTPDIRPVDLGTVINDEVGRFPGIAIHNLSATPPVLADDHLPEVFATLIENAVKFGGPDVAITIRAEEEDGFVRVSIEDTGPGIPDDEKEAIFFRYEQQKRGVGEGLGLYLAQILIRRYGGRIWADDRVPGHPEEGAALRFTLKTAWPACDWCRK